MSIESMAKALNVQGITPVEKLVLIGIANHDGDGGAWPSIKTLAGYACVSERTVQRTLAVLEEKGFVTRHYYEGGSYASAKNKYHRTTLYELHLSNHHESSCRHDSAQTPPGDKTPGDTRCHQGGDTTVSPGGGDTRRHQGGDTAVSPKPYIEPSIKNRPVNEEEAPPTPPLKKISLRKAERKGSGKQNRFPGKCVRCGGLVPSREGVLGSGNIVLHATESACAQSARDADRFRRKISSRIYDEDLDEEIS